MQGFSIIYYLKLATERSIVRRAIRVSILVGLILNLINSPEIFFSFSFKDVSVITVILTFFVPFGVSTYSSILSKNILKPGKFSQIDAILECKSCKETDFHIHIGEEIGECETCKTNTKWRPLKIFSSVPSDDDMLKSLALFARYNPQPLFRIDTSGVIIGSNPASSELFEIEKLDGTMIKNIVPEISIFNLTEIISKEEVKEIVLSVKGKFYNLVLKGVKVLGTVHVYGNDITEIILAEQKIKKQSEDIQQSIQYAWLIQKAMLPDDRFLSKYFPSNFVFYRPRDIVSGDFYWVNEVGKYKILVVADSTGHGVPGAFMSVMGISMLNEIILRENTIEADKILNTLRERIILSLESGKDKSKVADGMDMALIVFDEETKELSYSGAYNPLYIQRNGDVEILKADRMPVGKYIADEKSFAIQTALLNSGDRLYLFTDGYQDQIGGEKNKKLSSKKFRELLLETGKLPIKEQQFIIHEKFDQWKLDNEQIDDVLVVGVEV